MKLLKPMTPVKHWQDPVNVMLALWLIASPWVLEFTGDTVATTATVVIGVALAAAALGATLVPRAWEEWAEAVLGFALIVSPVVLGFTATRNAMLSAFMTGVVVLVLSLWVLYVDKDYKSWIGGPVH